MDIKIVDYNKIFEKEINKMLIEQWNLSFNHKDSIVGKIALYDNKFAGVCFGWKEKDYFYLDTLCISPEFQKCGIGTKLLTTFINYIKLRYKSLRGGG